MKYSQKSNKIHSELFGNLSSEYKPHTRIQKHHIIIVINTIIFHNTVTPYDAHTYLFIFQRSKHQN